MSKKHILVLSVSAGAGHVRAAQALCAAAERGFRQLRLTHVDVMDLVPAGFRKLYADSYIKLVEKMPLAWAYLLGSTIGAVILALIAYRVSLAMVIRHRKRLAISQQAK